MKPTLREPARNVPVIADADICVLGGSCTGVFAALRAARRGARVVLVERQNGFGGMATAGFVNCWHSLHDTLHREQIIVGLTEELLARLRRRKALIEQPEKYASYVFNSEELKIDLDELVLKHGVRALLHTTYCAPHVENGELIAVFVENKNGRGAVRAKVFIDATGDGDLAAHLGVPFAVGDNLQPPTTCAKILHFAQPSTVFRERYNAHREEFGLAQDYGWQGRLPGLPDMTMVAQSHVFNANCADNDQLSAAEFEGRRQIRAMMDLLRKYGDRLPVLAGLPSTIGIRETRRFLTDIILTEADVLQGRRFPDAIANGTYRVDVHHSSGGGFTFKYLDGTQRVVRDGGHCEMGRWRDETPENPLFYQIPYRTMTSDRCPNLLLAGRMIGADRGAFGAIRVMVNLNQIGEAAGEAAFLALHDGGRVRDVSTQKLRHALTDGGSRML